MRTVRAAEAVLTSPVVETNMMVSEPLLFHSARGAQGAVERASSGATRARVSVAEAGRGDSGQKDKTRAGSARQHCSAATSYLPRREMGFPARCESSIRRVSSAPSPLVPRPPGMAPAPCGRALQGVWRSSTPPAVARATLSCAGLSRYARVDAVRAVRARIITL